MYEVAISRFSASSETLKNFSAQFHDFRPIRAQIAVARRRTLRIMVRIVCQGNGVIRASAERLAIKAASATCSISCSVMAQRSRREARKRAETKVEPETGPL